MDVESDIEALLSAAHTLRLRLAGRSRSETFTPGSIAPELLRRAEELLSELPAALAKLQAERDEAIDAQFTVDENCVSIGWEEVAAMWRSRATHAEARAEKAEAERDEARGTCKTCKHFTLEDGRLGSCSRWYVGYGVRMEDVKDNEVLVEDDEGWAMLMGPDFGCVLHEIRAASSALGGGE